MKLRRAFIVVILGSLFIMPTLAWDLSFLRPNQTIAEQDSPRTFSLKQLVTEPIISNLPGGRLRELWDFPDLYEEFSPSIVIISAHNLTSGNTSLGTGFIIDDCGNIITNYHVIEGAQNIEIKLFNDSYIDVSVLGRDIDSDLALLSTNFSGKSIHSLKISSLLPEIGEDIVVIGSPAGLSYSITRGIVSAIRQTPGYGTTIQIDAAVSPGSSGSPVFNKNGEVVGVVCYVYTKGQNTNQNIIFQNLNFAISSKQILNLIGKVLPNSEEMDFPLPPINNAYSKAINLIRIHEYKNALPYLEAAIREDPNNAQAWANKAHILGELERYQEALQASEKAIQLDPQNTLAWVQKAAALDTMGRHQESLLAADRAIQLDPQNTLAWVQKAAALGYMGRYQESLLAADRAIQLDPVNALAWANKAVTLDNMGRYQEARQASERVIQLPKKPFTLRT